MRVSSIKIKMIAPVKGHIGFASCVVDNWLFLNNIAVFSRLEQPEKIRLVFPQKNTKDKKISLYYPLSRESYFELEKIIEDKIKEL
jgi:hypothetical protein